MPFGLDGILPEKGSPQSCHLLLCIYWFRQHRHYRSRPRAPCRGFCPRELSPCPVHSRPGHLCALSSSLLGFMFPVPGLIYTLVEDRLPFQRLTQVQASICVLATGIITVFLLIILCLVLAQWPQCLFSGDPACMTVAVLLLLLLIVGATWSSADSPRTPPSSLQGFAVYFGYGIWPSLEENDHQLSASSSSSVPENTPTAVRLSTEQKLQGPAVPPGPGQPDCWTVKVGCVHSPPSPLSSNLKKVFLIDRDCTCMAHDVF